MREPRLPPSSHAVVVLRLAREATLAAAPGNIEVQLGALHGVLFYLVAYGIMNAAAFGALMLLPARGDNRNAPATSAETFEDLAGTGREHVALGVVDLAGGLIAPNLLRFVELQRGHAVERRRDRHVADHPRRLVRYLWLGADAARQKSTSQAWEIRSMEPCLLDTFERTGIPLPWNRSL